MPSVAFGPYEVVARLATGGAANIFLARQPSDDGLYKLVCVKTLLPERAADPEFVDMFLDEARIASRLTHPTCVRIFDLGLERGTYYQTMEFILGETLWNLLATVARIRVALPPPVVACIIAASAEGLHHAHELTDDAGKPYNIVHRDVSPQNIMVTFDGHTKILDFGVAKAETGREATVTGIVKGKFSYMSPEQITGGTIDRRSDLYSLGIVLFECLASRRLYRAESPEEIARMMIERSPPRLRDLVPDVHPRLDAIAQKALARVPDHRFQSAQEMALALRDFLDEVGFKTPRAAIRQLTRERFGDRVEAAREVCEHAALGDFDESRLMAVFKARPVLAIDLFPNEANAPKAGALDVHLHSSLRRPEERKASPTIQLTNDQARQIQESRAIASREASSAPIMSYDDATDMGRHVSEVATGVEAREDLPDWESDASTDGSRSGLDPQSVFPEVSASFIEAVERKASLRSDATDDGGTRPPARKAERTPPKNDLKSERTPPKVEPKFERTPPKLETKPDRKLDEAEARSRSLKGKRGPGSRLETPNEARSGPSAVAKSEGARPGSPAGTPDSPSPDRRSLRVSKDANRRISAFVPIQEEAASEGTETENGLRLDPAITSGTRPDARDAGASTTPMSAFEVQRQIEANQKPNPRKDSNESQGFGEASTISKEDDDVVSARVVFPARGLGSLANSEIQAIGNGDVGDAFDTEAVPKSKAVPTTVEAPSEPAFEATKGYSLKAIIVAFGLGTTFGALVASALWIFLS